MIDNITLKEEQAINWGKRKWLDRKGIDLRTYCKVWVEKDGKFLTLKEWNKTRRYEKLKRVLCEA